MSVGRTAPMSRRRYSTACLAQACRVASDAPLAAILSGGPRLWPWTQRPRRLSVATAVAARHSSWLCGLRGQVDPNMRRNDQTTLQFFELVLKAGLEPARPEAAGFEATAAVSSTAWVSATGGRYQDRTDGPGEESRLSKPLHCHSANLPVCGAQGVVSNARPTAYKAVALPAELHGQTWCRGRVLKSRPRAYRARALPLSYLDE